MVIKNKKKFIISIIIIVVFVLLNLLLFFGILIAHSIVFKRVDYDSYDSKYNLLYSDLNAEQYPREEIKILSGKNLLTAYLYGKNNMNGLVVVSPGHADANDIKLYEIMYFVDNGWQVLCYDYTGSYTSQGQNLGGYTQSVYDLNNVLNYIEHENSLKNIPIVLFGHSLGAYASAAVLQYGHNIKSAVIASGFDTPKEQWLYSIERYTGWFHYLLYPYTRLFISIQYGKEQNLSAIDGINSVDIPVLVISGTNDIFYGGESPIYKKRNEITNSNCSFILKSEKNHNGHYDYFLTDSALEYQKLVETDGFDGKIDKLLYGQHDTEFMNCINDFLLSTVIEK